MNTKRLPILLATCFFLAANASAETAEDEDFLELSLEELISLEIPDVTSVSRKKQRLMDSAAAIYVISDEDIKRTGVTSIPDALRMVPGMQVAKLNANTWSISTRGFNYIFANKLLVLIDGRTVYSPLFSGVNWDVQDTLMEDIDRIEVIRGPGAALWGANAVNGVINVITKKTADTQGSSLSIGGGNEEKVFGSWRHGGEFAEDGFYKVYVKAFERDGMANADGSDAADDWKMRRAGFKTEWKPSSDSDLTVQGDIYEGTTRPALMVFKNNEPAKGMQTLTNMPRDQRGGNLIAYWKRTLSDTHDYSFRAVYDNYQNFDYRVTEKRNSVDFEFQHYSHPLEGHDLIWGLGYRGTWYELGDMRHIVLLDKNGNPKDKRFDALYSFFIQDDITLNDQWNLALSSRLEHNSFTGQEVQPNARLTWKAAENRTFWASVSSAVKTPSISETAVTSRGITFVDASRLPSGLSYITAPPYTLPISGNTDLKSEELTAIEFGYREQFNDRFRLDTTLFFNNYKNLVAYVNGNGCLSGTTLTTIPGAPVPLCALDGTRFPNYIVEFPTSLGNGLSANTYGFELVADWQANDWWKLQFNYSWLQVDGHRNKTDPSGYLAENEILIESLSANHTANVRSSMNLPGEWGFDLWVRYIDNLRDAGVGAHTALDLRLSKKLDDRLEFSLVGQNLFKKQRQEFSEIFSGLGSTQIQESWYAQIRWHY
ncbi:MAG: TonB-dependent receptor plug domain-containing protein [Endozoicomonas sp.]